MIIRHKVSRSFSTSLCTKRATEKNNYSNTVLLPKTKLPLRLEGQKLINRDNLLSSSSQFTELYSWQRTHLHEKEFILHDGPPYANGVPHMGHAINKILKDVILRTKILQGRKVHYIPGWDCHGLPIELKAITDNKQLDFSAIRQKAKRFASHTIIKQKEAFLSWGITGNWNNAYTTYHPDYIKNQIKQFYNLYSKKLVYRDIKPVYWSPSTRTALAEAELEYNPNHKSTAAIVKIKLQSVPFYSNDKEQMYALIWTTTPWTLPSNQAICYNPKLSYSLVKNITKNEYYIVATNLISAISKTLSSELQVIKSLQGDELKDASYIHPIYTNKILKFLPASHAVETKGTGLVHTAPAHGPEDYLVALENSIAVSCMVDENGKFTSQAGPNLEGLFVLSDGIKTVINLLGNDLLHVEDHKHSYPYDWRTKKPVILRASKQWFIDTNQIKQKALELLENVRIIPKVHGEVYRHHFKAQLQKRPYWCISRQRSWGVPIPVFYMKDRDDIIINQDTIEVICNLIDKNGCDFWWKLDMKDILQETLLKKYNLDLDNVKKGEDILDIWFDSGLSWSSVLPHKQVADLYLEGVDQFTGWFQSSLLTSTALRNKSPYETIYVHGFAVDENGKKMSKSLGNVINPQDIMMGTKQHKAYGVDALRWWVACHANQDAIAQVSTTVLQASSDEVQKIRSVLRFAVAALYDYENVNLNYNDLKLIDKYILHLMSCYHKEVQEYLNDYQYHKVKMLVIQLVTNISALYYTGIKDRLYCDPQDSLCRKSAQYVLNIILQIVTRSIAAILPHLAEELHDHFAFGEVDSYFKTTLIDIPHQWYSTNILDIMNGILDFRKEINKQIGTATLDKDIVMYMSRNHYRNLKEYMDDDTFSLELSDILQVASVDVIEDDSVNNQEYTIKIAKSNQHNCPRCRRFSSNAASELCYRCTVVLSNAKLNVVN